MSDAVPDFIKEDQAEQEPMDLNKLAPLIEALKQQLGEVGSLEAKLEEAKKALRRTQREEIPEIMRYFGYKRLTLDSKEEVKIKEDASVTIPEEKEGLFHAFLKERDEADIIKLQFAFPRMPDERRRMLFDLLNANDFTYEFKEGVHWQTQQSYFKKLLGVGEEDREEGVKSGKYLHPDAVSAFAAIFTFWTTSITAPKGGSKL